MLPLEQYLESAIERAKPLFTRENLGMTLWGLCSCLLGARVCLLGELWPMAPALLTAAFGAGLPVCAALAGCVIGAVSLYPNVPWYSLSVCVLYFALHMVLQKKKVPLNSRGRVLALGIAHAALMPVFCSSSLYALIMGVLQMGASLAMTPIFSRVLELLRHARRRHFVSDEEAIGLIVLCGVMVLGIQPLRLGNFSFSNILAAFIAMALAGCGGAAMGSAAAVAMGVTLASGGVPVAVVGSLGACALVAGACRRLKRPGAVAAFLFCNAILRWGAGDAWAVLPLWDAAVAGALLLLLPKNWYMRLASFFDATARRQRRERGALQRLQALAVTRLDDIAETFAGISGLFAPAEKQVCASSGEVQALMRQTSRVICSGCQREYICWGKDKQKFCGELLKILDDKRAKRPARIPAPLKRCRRLDGLLTMLDVVFDEYLRRISAIRRSNEYRRIASWQLGGMADALKGLAKRLQLDAVFDEELEDDVWQQLDRDGIDAREVTAQTGGRLQVYAMVTGHDAQHKALAASVSKACHKPMRLKEKHMFASSGTVLCAFEEARKLEAEVGAAVENGPAHATSGDTYMVRELDDGRCLIVLSDGMGSGEQAAHESGATVSLLAHLVASGFESDASLAAVNRLLMLRAEEMYATVDACLLDLTQGWAEFMKLGACATLVVRGGKAHVMTAETLPAGILDEAVPAVSRLSLHDGDQLILMSDGVADVLGDAAGEHAMRCLEKETAQAAANALLEQVKTMASGGIDDMSALVVRIRKGRRESRRSA